jgi:hypothetical protein
VDVATVDDGRWLSVDTVGAGAVVRVAPAHASDATPTTAYRHGRPNCVMSVRMVIAGEYALFVSNMQYVRVSPNFGAHVTYFIRLLTRRLGHRVTVADTQFFLVPIVRTAPPSLLAAMLSLATHASP